MKRVEASRLMNLLFQISFTVVMHKDKEENSHHDSHYRARELAAFAAYDHHHLDGEMFLQVSSKLFVYSFVSFSDFESQI